MSYLLSHTVLGYVVAVLVVMIVINVAAALLADGRLRERIAVACMGFLLGMLAMWIAVHVYAMPGSSLLAQSAPQLDQALYPLYSGASWGAPEATTSPDFGPVTLAQSAPMTGVGDIAGVSSPFTTYYQDKLAQAGWTEDTSREAGGPGAGISVYTKGDLFVVVEFGSVFETQTANAPEQCPCDVTFTLMSGTQGSGVDFPDSE